MVLTLDHEQDRPEGLPSQEALRSVPRPARGLELLGQLESSGYREPPWLVRRADGQILQLTPVLYAVLEAIDGQRGLSAIRAEIAEQHGLDIDDEDLAFLVVERLQPLGVLLRPDGTEPATQRANPLLGIRGRARIVDAERTGRVAARFAPLFNPGVVALVMAAFVASSWYLFATEGLGAALHDLFHQPGALLAVIALTIVSAAFHEVGHASACRYGGASPGVMGAGLYLVWPAFYTDVSDSYRLSRGGRLRVDLGGLYFNAVFSVATFVAWMGSGWDPLLVLIVLQLLQMVRQLVPLVRFDGYHVLADLVGVPDLFGRIKPVLRGLLPVGRRAEARVLKPWARAVITVWVLLVVPILTFSLALMVVSFPRLAATAVSSIRDQWRDLVDHWASADLAQVALGVLAILAIALPVVGTFFIVGRTARRLSTRAWRMTEDNPRARSALVLGSLCLAAALCASWWPQGQYRPIARGEQLTLPAITGWVGDAATGGFDLDDDEPAAARAESVVLASSLRNDVQAVDAPSSVEGLAGGHVFPDPPAAGPGDNQAVAVGYDDDQTVSDTATDLSWETAGTVDNRNEAYALASCRGCRTTAVAFQVVLVVGQHQDISPVNKAVARNEHCVSCSTRSLAVQLVLPLDAEPDAETRADVEAIWARAEGIDDALDAGGFSAARALVLDIEADIAALLELDDDLAAATTTTTAPAVASTTLSGADGPTTTADGSVTTDTGVTTTSGSPTSTTEPEGTTSTTTSPSTTEPPTTTTTAPP